jgi:60 kDa SS-A/Ro ribonucleoprotein
MIVGYLSLLQETATPADAVALIQKIRLPREAIPDRLLKSVEVWQALAVQSPMTALLRTLNRMTAVGVFDGPEGQSYEKKVTQALTNPAAIRGAKIHPINALSALRTYSSGKGVKGSLTWQPNREIVRALDQSFLASFEAQPSMGLRMMIGVDISGSMWHGQIAKIPGLVPGEAAWALAYQFYKTESSVKVMAFNNTPYDATAVVQEDGYLNVTKKAKQQSWDYGNTNCSALMQAATTQQAKVDVFVVITDNEHNHGPDPMAALAQYRKTSGINAKLIVIALTATEYSIGNTNDPGVLNIVGFDPVAPTIIRTFCQGTTPEQGAAGSEDSDSDTDNDNDD